MTAGTRVKIARPFYSRGEGTVLPSTFDMRNYVTVLWDDGSSSCEKVSQLARI